MEGIQTFKGSWPWIRPYSIPSCITHRPLPIYQISLKSKKLFVDGWTDGHFPPSNIIRSTFGSRPNAANANGYNKSQYVNIVNSQTSATCSKQHVVHLCQQGSSFELCNCNWLFQCKFGTNEGQWTLEPAANWPVNNNRNLQKMTNKLQH